MLPTKHRAVSTSGKPGLNGVPNTLLSPNSICRVLSLRESPRTRTGQDENSRNGRRGPRPLPSHTLRSSPRALAVRLLPPAEGKALSPFKGFRAKRRHSEEAPSETQACSSWVRRQLRTQEGAWGDQGPGWPSGRPQGRLQGVQGRRDGTHPPKRAPLAQREVRLCTFLLRGLSPGSDRPHPPRGGRRSRP